MYEIMAHQRDEDNQENKFLQFRDRAVSFIMDHPEINDGFDTSLAYWLGGDKLHRKYQEFKNSRTGQESQKEMQIHYLLRMWREHVGYHADVSEFIKRVKDKNMTRNIVEKLQTEFIDSNIDRLVTGLTVQTFDDAADKKCTLWSIMFAIQSACKDKFNVDLSTSHLRMLLENAGIKRKGSDSELLPKHFNNIFLKGIQDVSGDNFYTFRIRVEQTNFEEGPKRETDHNANNNHDVHIILEEETKHRVLLVIHFCHDFCICADKRSIDRNAFNIYPRIKKCAKHSLYKIIVSKYSNS